MSGLTGRLVLIIEDDFYLADDAQMALEAAGATVLGPVGNAEDAIEMLATTRPDIALVDVNLGDGASFESAAALKARGIPFVFLTGYDANIIPADYADAPRLQKPADTRSLLAALLALAEKG
ncbi:DNA-binding response OmpR family regulator [Sphingopyxis sp. OAS728]|uniref:response regulator n=1 Tax=Sphingopyxis sp. OAS728 TaxID=2663823 RepID=UPI00178A6F0F|nr:response regulator [Sphingopyxis sp. OAS728]MBE1529451.1 DNA-binding response OmpR family regulator [Sphingopyxis sp. OAS728]